MRASTAILSLLLASSTAVSAPRGRPAPSTRSAISAERAKPRSAVRLGVMTIDRYSDARVTPSLIAKSVFVPLATSTFPGTVRNLNSLSTSDRIPKHFVIGDGGSTRAFMSVDRRPGSPLSKQIAKIAKRMSVEHGKPTDAAVIEFVRAKTNDIIRWTAGSSANDGRAEFAWDRDLRVHDAAHTALRSVANHDIGHTAADAGQNYTVVPFEDYIREGSGYCIQKAILASLLLTHFKIPHRLVNGAVLMGPGRTVGHSWIELGDGRILDPAWASLSPRGKASSHVSGAYQFGGSERMENAYYPVLVASGHN